MFETGSIVTKTHHVVNRVYDVNLRDYKRETDRHVYNVSFFSDLKCHQILQGRPIDFKLIFLGDLLVHSHNQIPKQAF